MKSGALLLAGLLFTTSTFAQGTVAFANTSTTLITSYGAAPFHMAAPISGTNAYRIGLYVGPPGTPENSFALAGLGTNSNVLPGRFFGGNPFFLPSPTYPAGTTLDFQIRAWTLSAGLSYEEAWMNISFGYGEVGQSAIGQVTLAGGPYPPPALFGIGGGQIGGFFLGGVLSPPLPEPSTWALAALSLALSGMLRRSRR